MNGGGRFQGRSSALQERKLFHPAVHRDLLIRHERALGEIFDRRTSGQQKFETSGLRRRVLSAAEAPLIGSRRLFDPGGSAPDGERDLSISFLLRGGPSGAAGPGNAGPSVKARKRDCH